MYFCHLLLFENCVCSFCVDGTDVPKPHMLENMDYTLVPENAWKKLIKWYSLQNGQVFSVDFHYREISLVTTFTSISLIVITCYPHSMYDFTGFYTDFVF